MNIRIFNKRYWLRRFGEQKNVRGYLVSPHKDFAVSIHVHPTGTNTMQALPEGQRSFDRLEGHGEIELNVADEEANRKGDLLCYYGNWYECVSCQRWDHTVLSHFNYQFTRVPTDASGSIDLEKPTREPTEQDEMGAKEDEADEGV